MTTDIPGFGLAGSGGIAALLGGLFLSVTGQEIVARADLERGLVAVGVALLWALPRLAQARGLTHRATVGDPSLGTAPATWGGRWPARRGDDDFGPLPLDARVARGTRESLLGARGEVVAELRPAGFALIDGRRVDVIARGEFIARGERVEIVADEGYRRIARRLDPDERVPATL